MVMSSPRIALAVRIQASLAVGRLLVRRCRLFSQPSMQNEDLSEKTLTRLLSIDISLLRHTLTAVIELCKQASTTNGHQLYDVITILIRHDGLNLIATDHVSIIDLMVMTCFESWHKCSYDSLCVDAICSTLRTVARLTSGRVVIERLLQFASVVLNLSSTTSTASASTATATATTDFHSISIGPSASFGIPLSSAEVLIELIGQIASASILANTGEDSIADQIQFASSLLSESVKILIGVVMRFSSQPAILKAALRSINRCFSIPRFEMLFESSAQLSSDFMMHVVPLVADTVAKAQQAEQSGQMHMVEVVGPSIGLLCHVLLQRQLFKLSQQNMIDLLSVLVTASYYQDSDYIHYAAIMSIIQLISHDVSTFAPLLATVHVTCECSTLPMVYLLEKWTAMHRSLNSKYNKNISFFGLLAMMNMFAQVEANHAFAQRMLLILLPTLREEEHKYKQTAAGGMTVGDDGEEDGDDSQYDSSDNESEQQSNWEKDNYDVLSEDDDDDDDDVGDDEDEGVDIGTDGDDPFAPAEYFDLESSDPFAAYLSPSSKTASSSRAASALSGDADCYGMNIVHISSNLLYRPNKLDPLKSLKPRQEFVLVMHRLMEGQYTV